MIGIILGSSCAQRIPDRQPNKLLLLDIAFADRLVLKTY